MSRDLLSTRHHRHPMRRGEPACAAFAELDLAALARFSPGDRLGIGECEASEKFLMRRWGWSRGRVRGFLQELEEEGRLERVPDPSRGPATLRLLRYAANFMLPEDAVERAAHRRYNLPAHSAAHERDNSTPSPATDSRESRPTGGTAPRPTPRPTDGTQVGDREGNEGDGRKETRGNRPDDSAHSAVPSRAQFLEAVSTRNPTVLHAVARLEGFDQEAAAWTLALLDAPGEFAELESEERVEVLADARRDMARKGVERWEPAVALAFTVAAWTARTPRNPEEEPEKATPELGARLFLRSDASAPGTWPELAAALRNGHASRARR